MKRTTIMAEEDTLYELEQLARIKDKPLASIIREALISYINHQKQLSPIENPLLALAGLGGSGQMSDMANGGDEALLQEDGHPVYGWSIQDDRSN